MTRKNTDVLLISLGCFLISKGQISKGSILVGGQAGYYNSNINYSVPQPNRIDKNATLSVSFGEALEENSIYGLNITYQPAIDNYYNGANFDNSKTKQFSIGIFTRRYKKLAKDLYFFAEFGAAYITFKQTNNDTLGISLEVIKQSGGQLYLTPGISYRIFEKLHLEIIIPSIVSIEYLVARDNTPAQTSKQNLFLFNTSLNISPLNLLGIGFHFIL